ncbi:MAG: radical SAM protein [Lachnospiraceae bacterium]|nr:radical SAM protein [Lachnospiraceae bacterium]
MLKKILDDDVNSKTVVLLVTNSCNINCVYCYEHFKNAHYMQLDKMIEIADAELNANNEFERIGFNIMGGEPFLAFENIKKFTEYLCSKKWPKNWYISLSTNGTLVHGEIKKYMLQYIDNLVISLSYDGTYDMQDMNRSNSSSQIDLDFFAENFPYVKMTVSPLTLNNLADGVMFLQKKGFLVAANLALGIEWDYEYSAQVLSEQLEKLIDFYIENPEYRQCSILDMGIETINPLKKDFNSYCGAGDKLICYDWDGKKYPCHMFSPLSMSAEKAKLSNDLVFNGKIDREMLNEECKNCPAIQVCPSCEGMNFEARGNAYANDRDYCRFIKIQVLANAAFRFKQYKLGQLELTDEEEYRLLNNIRLIQRLQI